MNNEMYAQLIKGRLLNWEEWGLREWIVFSIVITGAVFAIAQFLLDLILRGFGK